MAGTLTISTLSDGANSTSSTNCIQGSAKAWVNFNGTTSPGTIRASYNVSSVTKNSTGNYTLNFTNAMTDANYAAAGAGGNNDGTSLFSVSYQTAATTTFRFATLYVNNTTYDPSTVCVSIFR